MKQKTIMKKPTTENASDLESNLKKLTISSLTTNIFNRVGHNSSNTKDNAERKIYKQRFYLVAAKSNNSLNH